MEGEALKTIVEHYQKRGISISQLSRSTDIARSRIYELFLKETLPLKDMKAILGFYGMENLTDKLPHIELPESKPKPSTKLDVGIDKRILLYEEIIEAKDELIHTLQEQVAEYRTMLKPKNDA